MTSWFNELLAVRIRSNEAILINEVVKENKDKYRNVSHFIRCGINKELRSCGKDISLSEVQ